MRLRLAGSATVGCGIGCGLIVGTLWSTLSLSTTRGEDHIRSPIFSKHLLLSDFVTDPESATFGVKRWLDEIVATGQCGFVTAGRFKISEPLVIDLASVAERGICIEGDGYQNSVLDISTRHSPCVLLQASGGSDKLHKAAFFPVIERLGVECAVDGPAVQIGQEDLSDEINNGTLDLWVRNDSKTARANAIEINGAYNMRVSGVFNNTRHEDRPEWYGDAVRLRASQFSSYSISCGNAIVCVHMTDGYSYGNVFSAPDFEEVTTALQIDSAHAHTNTFIGGQYSVRRSQIDATAGYANTLINPNFAQAAHLTHMIGISLQASGAAATIDPADASLEGNDEVGRVELPDSFQEHNLHITFRNWDIIPHCTVSAENGMPVPYRSTLGGLTLFTKRDAAGSAINYSCRRS